MTVGGSGPLGTGAGFAAWVGTAECLGVRAYAAGGAAPIASARITNGIAEENVGEIALRQPDVRIAGVFFDIV